MGAKEIDYHKEATADVKNAVDWYLERSPKAAVDFIQELERAIETIREAPDRWPIGRNGTRRFLLTEISFCNHLLGTGIHHHDLGRSPRKQATWVLDGPAVSRRNATHRLRSGFQSPVKNACARSGFPTCMKA